MVNFGGGAAPILGIFLMLAGAGLYFLRSMRPELARDPDIFFSAVGVLCGGILLFQGWRLDPILLFGQFLLTGSTIFFAYEAIRLRGAATEVAKRNTPIVDDDRPVSKDYRYYDQEAELYDYDRLEPEEELEEDRYKNPRLRGTVDRRNGRSDRYEGEARRSTKSRGSSERSGSGERSTTPKRRPRPTSRSSERPTESWDSDFETRSARSSQRPTESWNADLDSDRGWEDKPSRSSRPRSTPSSPTRDLEMESKQRRRRPPQDRGSSPSSRNMETAPTDVDYQPVDASEEETNTGRFDY